MSTHPTLSPIGAVALVTEREVVAKLQSRVFLIATGVLLLLAFAGVVWGGLAANEANDGPPEAVSVAVTKDAEAATAGITAFDVTVVANRTEAEQLVSDGTVTAAVITDPTSPVGLTVITTDDGASTVVGALSQSPTVVVLPTPGPPWFLGYLVAIGFGLVFFMAASIFGNTIAQSVVEEKSTRVVEVLVAAISARAMMAGKVIGNTILAMGQILLIAAIVVIGMSITGQTEILSAITAPIGWFAVFFLFGFVLLAALFAGTAALVSRQEDVGATTFPIMIVIMIPYFLVIFFNDNDAVLGVMSYVPFSAPVAMPMRLFLGTAQWWEPLLSLAILAVTCVAAILIGGRMYRNSLLRMGGRVRLSEAFAS